MTRSRSAGATVWLVVGLVAGLAGCAGIPTSGDVVEGEPIAEAERPPYVGFDQADPPDAGDSPEGIVAGFVAAMASYEPDYPTARLFLAPDAGAAWQPSARTTIYARDPVVTPGTDGRVQLTLAVLGTVSPQDGFVRERPDTTRDFALRLDQVNGEWRIANPPAGIIVSDLDFDSEFQAFDLYFFDPAFDVLVPEPVHVPIRSSGSTTTLLAEALLRGPSQWLAPAVRTAFPAETALAVRGVRVESGRAIVELTEQAADGTSDVEAERMEAQLVWTLTQIPGVRQVTVSSGGDPLRAGGPTAASVDTSRDYDPESLLRRRVLYAIAATGVVRLEGDGAARVPGLLGSAVGATDLAVNPLADEAAVVAANGRELSWASYTSEANLTPLTSGTDLDVLSWDRTGLVWVTDRTDAGTTLLVCEPGEAGSEPAPVATPDLRGRPIDDLAVSLDGTRVAVVSDGRVLVGLILRDPLVPMSVRVAGLRPVPLEAGSVTAVAWSGSTQLAVLVDELDADTGAYRIDLTDWALTATGPLPEGGVTLAAAPREDLAVGTADGLVLRQRTGSWNLAGQAARPVYPG
ncbi:MAG: LpqB family beta-propeller domain-containing protein [Jiangellaceae bacterium]